MLSLRNFCKVCFAVFSILLCAIILQRIFPVTTGDVHREAEDLFKLFSWFPVTNTLLTNWVIVLCVIFSVRWIVGDGFGHAPTRAQATLELFVEKLRAILEPVLGREVFRHAFPFLLILFTYLLIENLSGLLPGVGAFGYVDTAGNFRHFFRPTNADLNATVGLALASFFAWLYFTWRYAGPRAFFQDTFGNKTQRGEVPTALYFILGAVFIGVGFIDIISILFRIVSLSFRLYGNVFGGESLITRMINICAYVIPLPFYFLEFLIGSIQAFVFMILTAVYIGLLTNHENRAK
ncbi:MAG: F0F1 ATP synthase subunit A [Puniceicoccales bacterium]|jgi:F-type H+-transporting ATPase subunit a|nr:F0F1 ATP synthase subunit A [Puniceicoccales bacterium]